MGDDVFEGLSDDVKKELRLIMAISQVATDDAIEWIGMASEEHQKLIGQDVFGTGKRKVLGVGNGRDLVNWILKHYPQMSERFSKFRERATWSDKMLKDWDLHFSEAISRAVPQVATQEYVGKIRNMSKFLFYTLCAFSLVTFNLVAGEEAPNLSQLFALWCSIIGIICNGHMAMQFDQLVDHFSASGERVTRMRPIEQLPKTGVLIRRIALGLFLASFVLAVAAPFFALFSLIWNVSPLLSLLAIGLVVLLFLSYAWMALESFHGLLEHKEDQLAQITDEEEQRKAEEEAFEFYRKNELLIRITDRLIKWGVF